MRPSTLWQWLFWASRSYGHQDLGASERLSLPAGSSTRKAAVGYRGALRPARHRGIRPGRRESVARWRSRGGFSVEATRNGVLAGRHVATRTPWRGDDDSYSGTGDYCERPDDFSKPLREPPHRAVFSVKLVSNTRYFRAFLAQQAAVSHLE